ncbi:MAG: glycosyltransferase family 1 protein [Candidatus Latescibacterota bacterium]|jgi:glycosyltransferase involved in cell wall biosynthesis
MRLGVDLRELERGRMTGIGRYLRNLVAHAATTRPDHPLFLYGNQRTAAVEWPANVTTRVAPEAVTLWWDQVILPCLATQDRVEVFLSPYVKGPLRLTCPMAITVHDLMFLRFPAYTGWRRWPRNLLFLAMARRVGARADLVFTDSEYSARDLERFLGVDRARVQVVPLGIEERYRPVTDPELLDQVRSRYRIVMPYILYLGNFKPHKNVGALLRAYAGLPEGVRSRFALVLAGREDPWQREQVELARRLGLDRQALFVGRVDEADLPALYSAATVFAFPSLYEGFGLPPLEAMACGTPVVAANCTSIPEVVGEAGLLIDPQAEGALTAALRRLLEDEELRRRLREQGLERAGHFRAADLCERQVQLLEGLAERGRA